MNDIRSSYVKVLPLVFLAGLLIAALKIYIDYHYGGEQMPDLVFLPDLLLNTIKNGLLWAGVGLAFKRMKEAALAFGVSLLMIAADLYLYKINTSILKESVVLSNLYAFLFNVTFLPSLVFGLVCFKKSGLRYFLPLWLLTYAILMMFVGSVYLDMSPYNTWYRMLRIEHAFKVYTGEHSYRVLNLLSYLYNLAAVCITFIIIGECFTAAANKKKLNNLFRVDLSTRYTRTSTLSLFYALRLIINLLVIGLYAYPLAYTFESGRIYYRGQSLLTLCLVMATGLTCLAAVALYYRRFLIEYFISIPKKINWLFWIVNIPVVGMLVFPFVALFSGANKTVEERTLFFFNDAMYYQKPYKILMAMLVMSLLSMWLTQSMRAGSDAYWVLWLVNLALLIWYATSISGYYVVLGAAGVMQLIYWSLILIEKQSYKGHELNFGYSESPFYQFSISLWLISSFNVVQYVVLLPVFHLNTMKVNGETSNNMNEIGEICKRSTGSHKP
jgi:hypothetical protein